MSRFQAITWSWEVIDLEVENPVHPVIRVPLKITSEYGTPIGANTI